LSEGLYVIGVDYGEYGTRPVGTAIIRIEADRYYFAAKLRGQVEVRGLAHSQGSFLKADWENAGARDRRNYFQISGVVTQRPDGLFEGYGRSASDDAPYSILAGRLPD
jgi:hypothetical protein